MKGACLNRAEMERTAAREGCAETKGDWRKRSWVAVRENQGTKNFKESNL